MERTNRGFVSTCPLRNRPNHLPAGARRTWADDRLNPKSPAVNRSLRGSEFARFADELHRDLDPRGPLEAVVVRQAIRSAWRLKVELDGEVDPMAAETPFAGDSAGRALEVAITTLDLLQGRRQGPPTEAPTIVPIGSNPFGWATVDSDDRLAVESNEWPVVPVTEEITLSPTAEAESDTDDAPIWQGRLVYDFDVSDLSPVVKGTWITVSHVVSLIVDGASWADILRSHPELTEADIRVCVAYAIAEDGQGL